MIPATLAKYHVFCIVQVCVVNVSKVTLGNIKGYVERYLMQLIYSITQSTVIRILMFVFYMTKKQFRLILSIMVYVDFFITS